MSFRRHYRNFPKFVLSSPPPPQPTHSLSTYPSTIRLNDGNSAPKFRNFPFFPEIEHGILKSAGTTPGFLVVPSLSHFHIHSFTEVYLDQWVGKLESLMNPFISYSGLPAEHRLKRCHGDWKMLTKIVKRIIVGSRITFSEWKIIHFIFFFLSHSLRENFSHKTN